MRDAVLQPGRDRRPGGRTARHGRAADRIGPRHLRRCGVPARDTAVQPAGRLARAVPRQSPPDRTFVRGFLAAALSASLILLVPVIVRALASTTAAGAIAAMNYALKLAELPAGVLVTSVATVALARLSGHYGGGDAAAARTSLHEGLQRSITNATGAGLVMAYFADAIVQLVLGRGAMGPTEVQRVVDLSRLLMAGLPFLAVSSMATADLNARERPQTVLRVTLACLLLLPVLALPGVVWNSEVLLAAAVVGFQAVHAAALAYASGLTRAEGRQWLNAKMAGLLGTALALVACFIALDRMFSGGHSVVRLALASLALLSIIVLPHRLLAPPRRSKDSRS
ncbi:hypothetical protein FSC37_03215 [Piscinibacter aquaticus]|uniref:Oligosaccharide flippase family protein n=1 Tax=Piscinibacter aquaticus TaxID=392597 RepID=A0A5C6U0J8_9BURK|nr:hypothetical protein FSC37_03215 [Piscinibacter aquaticus]